MTALMWEVWDEAKAVVGLRRFSTLKAAERAAHKAVANDGGGEREICRSGQTVAYVRMDGAGRVWTDVVDCTVA